MVLIRLGEPAPVREPRRVRFGPAEMLALQESLERAGAEHTLPDDLRLEVDPIAAALADVDLAAITAQARALLQEHGVLGPEAPVDAVLANLAALVSEPLRVRTSLSGPGTRRLAWHWVGADLGGSLAREDDRFELSLFDARTVGDEILRGIPVPEGAATAREPFTVPLAALGTLLRVDDRIDPAVEPELGRFVGLPPEEVVRVRRWTEGITLVLHLAARPRGEGDLPPALVWALDRSGWWASEVSSVRDEERTATWTPAGEPELRAAVGSLLTGAWF